jgi:arsenate reductase
LARRAEQAFRIHGFNETTDHANLHGSVGRLILAHACNPWLIASLFLMSTAKPVVLILCTGNSCRSHLAEGILHAVAGDILDVQSAGSRPAGYVHPLAIAAMKEIDIDISGHRSKPLSEFVDRKIETVITVCGDADAACPMFPGQVNRHHWPFEDPAQATGTEEEKLAVFRRVRDEIRRIFTAYANGRRDAPARMNADEP